MSGALSGPNGPTAGRGERPPVPRRVTVVLVDDQPLVRAGLRWVLAEADGFTIVAECGDGAEAVAAVRARPRGVDVVLMDVRMRGVDGIEATRRLRELDGPPVLILTTFDEDEVLWGAIEAGAAGFVLKDASAEDLIAATRTVAGGGAWLDPAVTPRVLEVTRRSALPRHREAAKAGDLTERELDVLRQIATGASNGEIARELVVSEATVKTHVGSIFAKLGVRDRAGAIVYAYQHGISSP
jgi:DNA-binding NarL/FixJ family response regulator